MANDYIVTVDGLKGTPSPQSVIQQAQWAIASGTVNALTAAFTPQFASYVDGMFIGVRASGANTSTTVTINVDGLGAVNIKKKGNVSLATGDINAAGHELLLRYNLAGNRFELLNPAS